MNKVILSGNLTRDPELRYTPNGKANTRVGIAVRRIFATKNPDGTQTDVDFFNLVAWDKTAEFIQRYFAKGSRLIVEGRLQTYNYEGKDGTKKSGVDIIVDNVEFADSKRVGSGNSDGGSFYDKKDSGSKNYNPPPDDDFDGEDADTPF